MIKKVAILAVFLSFNENCQAQDVAKEGKPDKSIIFTTVQVLPEFPGGMMEFRAYVSKNYKVSPTFKGKGNVILSFVVEIDGSITNIKVLQDLGYGTGEEAIRLLRNSPKWNPGTQDGIPVRVSYNLPIKLSVK